MEKTITKQRYDYLDFLKALGIFLVVVYHYNNMTTNLFQAHKALSYFNYFTKSFFSTCVPIFFLVNGALLLNKDFNLKKHIYKIINIIILTIIWGILTLLLLMPICHQYMTLTEFANSLWTWKQQWINHLWFFHALVVIYIFFPLIKTAYDNNIKYIYFFLTVAFILTFGNTLIFNFANVYDYFILHSHNFNDSINFFNDFNAFRGICGFSFVYFILGGLLFKHKEYFREKKWVIISICSIAASMIILTAYGVVVSKNNGQMYDIIWNGYDTLPAICMVIAVFILSLRYKSKGKITRFINFIGKNSLGIFLIHRIWGSLFDGFFHHLDHSQNIVSNFIFGLFILLISLGSVVVLKKIPVVKRLFTIG